MPDLPKAVSSWLVVRELGKGGQGTVYLVRSPERAGELEAALVGISKALSRGGVYGSVDDKQSHATDFLESLAIRTREDRPEELGAGKVYKIPPGPLADKAIGRLKVEFDVLSSVSSPHILRLLHTDLGSRLMVSEYHPDGTLAEDPTRFIGRPLEALRAFRGLVQAAADLHSGGIVHRDIKPANIFVARDGRLVLGDFGIVFVEGGDAERLTDTFERVGTRDWMPPWAHTGTRIDDVRPSFDVFSLGKVLWSMLSGRSMLPLWYWSDERYDLTRQFPGVRGLEVINRKIVSRGVVEREEQCLPDASVLLAVVDEAISLVQNDGQILKGSPVRCRVCGRGIYKALSPDRLLALVQPELKTRLSSVADIAFQNQYLQVRYFTCEVCGHLELFHFADTPVAWR